MTVSDYWYPVIALLLLISPNITQAQVNDQTAIRDAVQSTERMLRGPGGGALDLFIDSKLSVSFRASRSRTAMREYLTGLRAAVAGADGLDIARENDEIHLKFTGGTRATIVIRLAEDEPGKISHLVLNENAEEIVRPDGGDQETALRLRVRSLESLSRISDEEALTDFMETHFTESLRASFDREELFSILRSIGRASAGAGSIMIAPGDDGVRLSFRGSTNADVFFSLEEREPFRIKSLSLDTDPADNIEVDVVSIPPIMWDNLAKRLKEEESAGFSGIVLVVRDGQTVLHEGYGMANEEEGIPNTIETIFGIGSTPIDFTKAAILLLTDRGKLSVSDPISRFFPEVPQDKAAITLGQLMTGRSGLPNFHHNPEKDDDYDLTWIDRDEAVRRILGAELLFDPGTDQSHSHSAFGLLAAVIEEVSGGTYTDFLIRHFFEPLGMTHTGFYGSASGFNPDQMAVGYGVSQVGEVNMPYYWGPTSWLVMGSGGMVSNPGDMYRWVAAIQAGDLLSDEARRLYGSGNVLAGGSDRGFLFVYVDDADNTVLIGSNNHERPGDRANAVSRGLVKLVTGK